MLLLSTEIVGKRRKIYSVWRETSPGLDIYFIHELSIVI